MAAERFFTKIANDVLQASEQIATRMEEGLGVVFRGESSTKPPQQQETAPRTPTFEDDNDMEELLMGNPLQGMAESVLQGIMEGQVRQ